MKKFSILVPQAQQQVMKSSLNRFEISNSAITVITGVLVIISVIILIQTGMMVV